MRLLILVLAGLLAVVAGKNLDDMMIKRLMEALNEEEQEKRGAQEDKGTEKRQLYGASWNAKTQTITLHPQRTKNCMEKNACIFNLSFLDDQGKVIATFAEWKWPNNKQDGTLHIPLEEILVKAENEGKPGKGEKIDDKGALKVDNELNPDMKEIVCKMCRLVDGKEDLWTCNKRTLDLTKDKDVNFWRS